MRQGSRPAVPDDAAVVDDFRELWSGGYWFFWRTEGLSKWRGYRRFGPYPRDYEVNDAGCRLPPEERLLGFGSAVVLGRWEQ
jgi:hypothetical protein